MPPVSPILTWIQQNPSAVKAYLAGVLALIAKIILAFTGAASNLGPWTDIVNQLVDLLVGATTIYSILIGSLHVSRGPLPTPAAQAAIVVAAIQTNAPEVTVAPVDPVVPVTESRSF